MNNKSEEKFVSLEEIMDSLKTGDLVFFQGWGIDSVLIRNITGGRWSHVGIIVDGKDIGLDDQGLLLFESTNRPGVDINSAFNEKTVDENEVTVAPHTKGVMLLDFISRMDEYAGSKMYSKFGIKSLNPAKSGAINREDLTRFVMNENVRKSVYPPEYKVAVEHFVAREVDSEEFSQKIVKRIKPRLTDPTVANISDEGLQDIANKIIESLQDDFEDSTFSKMNHSHDSVSHYFCSELVADTLMHMGVVETKNAARYSPNDLSDKTELPVGDYYDEALSIPSSADNATEIGSDELKEFFGSITDNN
ncbi:MAG: hypothetical protein ACJAVI_004371 [Candidatus Azotimanducaceae bacterium]|jgi:hypothetical protein